MSDATLTAMARHGLAHLHAGTMELAADTMGVPAGRYTAPQRLRSAQDAIHCAPTLELPRSRTA